MPEVHAQSHVTTAANIRRTLRLPRGSMPKVLLGQGVKTADVLAISNIVSEHRMIDLLKELRVSARRAEACLVKRAGAEIEKGELLATRRGFLGLRKRQVFSPIDGYIVRIDEGQLLLEGRRERLEVQATMPGRVVAIEPEQYVTIETRGARIQAPWGRGTLTWGTLKVMDSQPSATTEAGRFNIDHRGAIVAIGSPLTREFLKGAADISVRGVIASSMHASLVEELAQLDLPVILTQGFGLLPMSDRILSVLKTYNGREVVLDPGEGTDWRDRRPEIIIPLPSQQPAADSPEEPAASTRVGVGHKVRILQSPYMGQIGTVVDLPDGPRRLPSGLWAAGVIVQTEDDDEVFVAFANLEHLG